MHIVFPGIVKIERIPFLIENGIKPLSRDIASGGCRSGGGKAPEDIWENFNKTKIITCFPIPQSQWNQQRLNYPRNIKKELKTGYKESRLTLLKSWSISPTSFTPNAVWTTFISSWRAQSAM
jgi:hypothetical protein